MIDHKAAAEAVSRYADAETTLGDDQGLTNALLAGVLHALLGLHDLLEALQDGDDTADTLVRPAVVVSDWALPPREGE